MRGTRVIAWIVIVFGVVMAAAGVVTWVAVQSELADEHITVSKDAARYAGEPVDGPLTAYSEAETIQKHALEASGGKTYAQMAQDDPKRQVVMTASFLRASLFTSIVSFGVAAMAFGVGLVLILLGAALVRLTSAVAAAPPVYP